MLKDIPAELRSLKQWGVSTETDKAPRMPNGALADVGDKKTWSTFDECLKAIGSQVGTTTGFQRVTHIGFFLAADGPYTIIDLDLLKGADKKPLPSDHPDQMRNLKAQQAILTHFDSYTERSRSGMGYHIIIRGKKKPGSKSRKDAVEVYDQSRYMIFTGVIVNGQEIADQQAMLDILCDEMGKVSEDIFDIPDGEEQWGDAFLLQVMSEARNGEAFNALSNGQWEGRYKSQSEADLAFVQWVAAFTPSNDQVERLFFGSGLARRDKARRRDYFPRTLAQARRLLAGDRARQAAREAPSSTPLIAVAAPQAPITKANGHSIYETFPPGLVGDIARYIYESSYLPAQPIALAGALAMMAGMCGRAFNVNGDGLNLYLVLLAGTGRGKESAQDGVVRLIFKMIEKGDMQAESILGPGHFSSGQALHKFLADPKRGNPVFCSFLGEFGQLLEALSGTRANSAEIQLRKMLLLAYSKSGRNKMLTGMEYSDQEKNVGSIRSPALSFLGETTPDQFLDLLEPKAIREGLYPRFIIIEHEGDVPEGNPEAEKVKVSEELIDRLKQLHFQAMAAFQNNSVQVVNVSDGARQILKALEEKKRAILNARTGLVEEELWNRCVQNSQRIAGLVAVGLNPTHPVVTEEHASWAVEFITTGMNRLLSHFKKGDVGRGSNVQLEAIKSIIDDFLDKPFGATYSSKPKYVAMKAKGWVPREYLMTRAANRSCFSKDDKQDLARALDRALQEGVDHGVIREVAVKSIEDLGYGGRAWVRISK